MKPKPKAVLIQENIPRVFDATALSNMKLVDVARALDSATSKKTVNRDLVRQLLSRILAGVSTAALGVMGRPEQLRLIRHLNRGLDRIISRMNLDESLLREGYYSEAKGLAEIIDRWQLHGDKLYDHAQPQMLPVADLWPYREYTWTRKDARLTPQEWDTLKRNLSGGWKRREPLYFEIGRQAGAKVGEGNHRLSLARELRLRQVPVRFIFKAGTVRKDPQRRGPALPPKAPAPPVSPTGPIDPETERRINNIMDLLS